MRKYLILLILLVFSIPFNVNGSDERFCIQKIQAPDNVVGIDEIYEFQKSPHTIYLLGKKDVAFPALLEGNEFKKLNFKFRNKSFIELPNGTILVTGNNYMNTPTSFFKLEKDSKRLEEIKVEGIESLLRLVPKTWSTPLGGVLLTQSGTLGLHGAKKELPNLFLLKENKATKIEEVEGDIEKIVDFPELNITFLGTAEKDGIYIIDGNKTLHKLGELSLGKWIYFSNIFHLKNQNRLLVNMSEALGPYHGLFLINLINSDGVWKPAPEQNFTNIFQRFKKPNNKYQQTGGNGIYLRNLGEYIYYGRDYEGIAGYYWGIIPTKPIEVDLKLYRVGAKSFEEIKNPSGSLVSNLPNYILELIGLPPDPLKIIDYNKTIIDMPDSHVKAEFTKADIQIKDAGGIEFKISVNPIEYNQYFKKNDFKYLSYQKAVFINAVNGYFLLKDKNISGKRACHD